MKDYNIGISVCFSENSDFYDFGTLPVHITTFYKKDDVECMISNYIFHIQYKIDNEEPEFDYPDTKLCDVVINSLHKHLLSIFKGAPNLRLCFIKALIDARKNAIQRCLIDLILRELIFPILTSEEKEYFYTNADGAINLLESY